MKLVKFQKDWADEFYTFGFCVFADEEWNAYQALASDLQTVSFIFGTNEGWEDWPTDELLSDMRVEEITHQEAVTIMKFFGSGAYGIFPDMDFLEESKDWNDQ